jgi:dipeptide/tripeptide permease
MLGYIGGFIGPLIIGWTLDLGAGMSHATWTVAFLIVAMLSIIALVAFWLMQPNELLGDRQKK